ncbi:MAG TPA: NAD(P)-dependent oxidoreductase, partial [Candidatus Tectomicrobia bacterium]
AYLVNTARAELIDTPALITALRENRIAGSALDVFDQEPIEPDDPLLALPNLILTPHVGFRTPEATRRSITIAIENLLGYFTGEPRNVVNVEGLGVRG